MSWLSYLSPLFAGIEGVKTLLDFKGFTNLGFDLQTTDTLVRSGMQPSDFQINLTGGNGMDMNTLILFMLLSGGRGGGSMMKMILLMSLLGGSGSGTNPFSSVTPTAPQTPFNIGELLSGLFGTKDGVPTTGSNPTSIVSTAPMSGELPSGFYTTNPDGSYSPTTPSNTWSPIYS